jgi:3-methyl-2-oxobutanoate hydroxymethyltransferase
MNLNFKRVRYDTADIKRQEHFAQATFPLSVKPSAATVSPMTVGKITPASLRAMKAAGRRIASLTAYDYAMARLLDEAGIPLLLVGDSLGMLVLGYPDTTHVSMAEMEHHVRAAARARPRALLAADLPYHSYETPEQAVENGRRLMAAGAEAVKAEGGRSILPQIVALVQSGIPFLGHLGMLPQHVLEEGRYRIKGRNEEQRLGLLADAKALEEAGAFGIVLELVLPAVAEQITAAVAIPTIGIGSGAGCDGQILVTPDLLGLFPWFTPKFVTQRMKGGEQAQEAVRVWVESVEKGLGGA